jgi:hypothetical protein
MQRADEFSPVFLAPAHQEIRPGGFSFYKINPGAVGAVRINLQGRIETYFIPGRLGGNLRQVAFDGFVLPELAV